MYIPGTDSTVSVGDKKNPRASIPISLVKMHNQKVKVGSIEAYITSIVRDGQRRALFPLPMLWCCLQSMVVSN